jgi:hypothetical protein
MKLIYIILMLWVLSSSKMGRPTISRAKAFNIQITKENIRVKSTFPDWEVTNTENTKKGLNEGYYVVLPGISFEYKITKY